MESPIIDHGMERPQGPHHRSRHGPSRGASDCCCIAGSGPARAQTELRESGNDMPTRSDSGQPRAKCVRSKRGVEPHLSCRRSEFRVTILILNLIVIRDSVFDISVNSDRTFDPFET